MRFIIGTLTARFSRSLLLWHLARLRLPIHAGWLMVALWWWRVLTRLLLALLLLGLLLLELIAATVRRQRLTVGAIELSVCWWWLPAPDGVRGHESLGLRAHWSEDTFLRKSLAIGAATVFRLIEARASDLLRAREHSCAFLDDVHPTWAYLASATITTRDGSSLTRCRLRSLIRHRLLWIVRIVNGLRRWQRAILIRMLWLQGLHCGRALRHRLRDWRHLF